MQGVAIMMNQEATRALIDWSPINERIIKARFYSKFVKVTMIHVYAPTMMQMSKQKKTSTENYKK